jgi:hypothetical protein
VILQAATWHEFINQKVVFIFKAISNNQLISLDEDVIVGPDY